MSERRQYDRTYGAAHKEQRAKYVRDKRSADCSFRTIGRLRNGLRKAFRLYAKQGKIGTANTYGVSYQAIVDKVGSPPEGSFQLDHILPCVAFNHDDPFEVWACWHPENFQWLSKTDNLSKNREFDEKVLETYLLQKKLEYVQMRFGHRTEIKLHIGCGTVYLNEYINIDGAPDYFAHNCDSLILDQNATSFDHYYKRTFGTAPGYIVADLSHDLRKPFPFQDGTVDEIVMYQVLEHIPAYDTEHLLSEIVRILKTDGVFVVSVPDVKATAKLLVEAKTEQDEDWSIRLIHGTQKNQWSHHYCGFVPRTLKALLSKCGFNHFESLPSINIYPVIHLKAIKER